MRVLLGLVMAALVSMSACGKREAATPAPATNAATTGNPITAPADYLGAVSKAKKVSEKTIDTAYLNQAIQMFHAAEGRYPKDLNELVAEKYIPRIPDAPYNMKIVYDGASGQVKIVAK